MEYIFPYLIAGVVVLSLAVLFIVVAGKKGSVGKKSNKSRTQAQIIKEANKRLARNPNDPEGLLDLGNLYFSNKVWDKAYPIYDTLAKIAGKNNGVDAFTAVLRCGICALNLDKLPEANANLIMAYKIDGQNFDVNYYMGKLLFKNKDYEKVIPCLKKALIINPEAEGIQLMLGQAYYSSRHYHDSIPCFKSTLTEDPSNKEALFCMADAMAQEGHADKAIKVFTHLRPDPVYGAKSCLRAGVYHMNLGDFATAVQDFEIGLKHENTSQDVLIELEYNMARCWFSKNQFGKGLELLNSIRLVNPNYKDVSALIARYQELSQNTNLQVYLSSGSGDFVSLCRRFIAAMYKGNHVKIMDIDVGVSYTDINAEVDTPKWQAVEVFRFFRSTGSTGEIYVRELHGHLKDVKADKGICVCAGTFSEEAHRYIEGRPIDLIEKPQLTKILKMVNV